ncbi:diguanylate cyclase [Sulfurimonas sp.]|uniref:diguanylate cyclase n=1 Tax=Sulfurimonas sp. TaxID=2022749 RepID=UPI003D106D8B
MKIALLAFLFTLSLFAQELERVTLQLDWKFQFENVGFIMAQEKGFYKEAGVDVTIVEYERGTDIVDSVLKQKSNYGVYHSSIFIEDGKIKPIILLATYLQRSPLIFISHTEIKEPQEMQGKTIMGTSNELKYSALGLMLKHYNITKENSTIKEHTFDINTFIEKKVDIMSGFTSNQLFELDQRGVKYHIIKPMDFGFNMSASNLFASKKEIEEHPQRTKKFIEASNRGWNYAINHIEESIEVLQKKYGVTKSKEALVFEAHEIKKLMILDFFKIGEINKELTELTFRQLKRSDFIDSDAQLHRFSFDDVLKNIQSDFDLTNEERAYLQAKGKIRACIDPEWYPFEAIRDGKYIGIGADVMQHFASKLGIPIEHVHVSSWQESIINAQRRECDIFSLATETPKRALYMNFTQPYLSLPVVVVTTNEKPFFETIAELRGKKIAAVEGYSIIEVLASKYPSIEIVEVGSIKEGLDMVMRGEIYGYIDNLMVVSSYIQRDYTGVLKVSARLGENLSFSIGTRSDEPILLEIFDKVIPTLTDEKRQSIYNRWVSVVEEVSSFDKTLLYKVLAIIALIVGFFLHREYMNKKYNAKLLQLSITDKLTGLYNRLKTDETLEEEHKKVRRFKEYETAVAILDVDFFKHVNDTYGHQAGDSILKALAHILRANTRETDTIGRWGGEEFMIIFTNTSLEDAKKACEGLREKIAQHSFEKTDVTASFGVGLLEPERSIFESISLVDEALYQAKESGRNRVVTAT